MLYSFSSADAPSPSKRTVRSKRSSESLCCSGAVVVCVLQQLICIISPFTIIFATLCNLQNASLGWQSTIVFFPGLRLSQNYIRTSGRRIHFLFNCNFLALFYSSDPLCSVLWLFTLSIPVNSKFHSYQSIVTVRSVRQYVHISFVCVR